MQIGKIVEDNDLKRSHKIEALKKVLAKIEKKEKEVEAAIKNETSKKKLKKLKNLLKTHKRHRHKAKKFIEELS